MEHLPPFILAMNPGDEEVTTEAARTAPAFPQSSLRENPPCRLERATLDALSQTTFITSSLKKGTAKITALYARYEQSPLVPEIVVQGY